MTSTDKLFLLDKRGECEGFKNEGRKHVRPLQPWSFMGSYQRRERKKFNKSFNILPMTERSVNIGTQGPRLGDGARQDEAPHSGGFPDKCLQKVSDD